MICTKVPILPRPLTRTFHVVPASSRDVGTHFYLGELKNPNFHIMSSCCLVKSFPAL